MDSPEQVPAGSLVIKHSDIVHRRCRTYSGGGICRGTEPLNLQPDFGSNSGSNFTVYFPGAGSGEDGMTDDGVGQLSMEES